MFKNNQVISDLVWDDIRYFLALARNGSLSAASRHLNVEHSTVSRRVGQLEAALSVRLFDRLAKGWDLTPEGQDLLTRAETVEQEVLALRRTAAGIDPLLGTVRISAPPMILGHFVPHSLRPLIDAHPDLTFELVGERREADLIRAEADIALRIGQPTQPDLVTQLIGDVTYGFYGLATACAKPRRFIGFDASMPDLPQKHWLDSKAAGQHIIMRTNDMGTMLHAALDGCGLALLPDFLGRSYGALKRLEEGGEGMARPLFLVMHPDVRRSRRVRLVADCLVNALKSALRQTDPAP